MKAKFKEYDTKLRNFETHSLATALNESMEEEKLTRTKNEPWNDSLRVEHASKQAKTGYMFYIDVQKTAQMEKDLPGGIFRDPESLDKESKRLYVCRYNSRILIIGKITPEAWMKEIEESNKWRARDGAKSLHNPVKALVKKFMIDTCHIHPVTAGMLERSICWIEPRINGKLQAEDDPNFPSELEIMFDSPGHAQQMMSNSNRDTNKKGGPRGSLKIKVPDEMMTRFRFILDKQILMKREKMKDNPEEHQRTCCRWSEAHG